MDYKKLIEDELMGALMTDQIEVKTIEHKDDNTLPTDMLKFSALIGHGKKGGFLFSMDINKYDVKESIELGIKILQAQLILYAVQNINEGNSVAIVKPYVPTVTQTVLCKSNEEAQFKFNEIASLVSMYDLISGTLFDKTVKFKLPTKIKKISKEENDAKVKAIKSKKTK
jgi:hypothetical protein